jgi:Tfp pilus assembly protein PilZ
VGENLSSGSIVRLSVAGAEIDSSEAPSEGREIFLKAELVDGAGEVVMHGRVQWVKPGRFAVRFGSLGVRATRAIVQAARRA